MCSVDSLRDFSSFDKMVVHIKLQTCFVLPERNMSINDYPSIEISNILNTV